MVRLKGSKNKQLYRRETDRHVFLDKAWRSMRIMRNGFTALSVLMTSVDEVASKAELRKVRRFLMNLATHGYIRKVNHGGWRKAGEYQVYALAKDRVTRPVYCESCGQAIKFRTCDPSLLKKETKKKRKKETEKETALPCSCEVDKEHEEGVIHE